jgi:hypothetical protein
VRYNQGYEVDGHLDFDKSSITSKPTTAKRNVQAKESKFFYTLQEVARSSVQTFVSTVAFIISYLISRDLET